MTIAIPALPKPGLGGIETQPTQDGGRFSQQRQLKVRRVPGAAPEARSKPVDELALSPLCWRGAVTVMILRLRPQAPCWTIRHCWPG
ncbi:hypothetical protein NDU88_003602 [Pleurodeles waltl]|uniref:Uncharacterized protein n=1 Tax=Pleurodeles waltl TaxID=8319 RepID=A0AAV7RIZ4_PLEWA|nr:hypothetical protein NDU88_003602 [Pleurodeles waltl]